MRSSNGSAAPSVFVSLFVLCLIPCLANGEVLVPGVPDYQQSDFAGTNDCAPIASADVLGYWDANGYPRFIDGLNDFASNPAGVTALVNSLKTNMHSTSSGTQISWIWLGIALTASQMGYSFSTQNDGAVSWNDIMTEVEGVRPAVLTMFHRDYGGMHSVAVIGFDQTGLSRIAILHDAWYPPNEVHLSFDECSDRTLTTVLPELYVDDDAVGDPGPGDPTISDQSEDGSPAHPYDALQKAIQSAHSGVTIIVLPGVYSSIGNRDIDLLGKTITVRSRSGPTECIIECGGSAADPHSGFIVDSGEGKPVIEGFTIRHGYSAEGGGIYCRRSSPTIRNCIIVHNTSSHGGGIFCEDASPIVLNCTVAYNSASAGGGIYCAGSVFASMLNSVFWGNAVNQIQPDDLPVSFCDVEGGYQGGSNLDAPPLFADLFGDDYHLKSRFGRWTQSHKAKGEWVYDDVVSPCIDRGDPSSDFSSEPYPNGDRIDIGAYGNTTEASKSSEWWTIRGDMNDDCVINVLDMIIVRNHLGQSAFSGGTWKADLNSDGRINILDLLAVRNSLGLRCM